MRCCWWQLSAVAMKIAICTYDRCQHVLRLVHDSAPLAETADPKLAKGSTLRRLRDFVTYSSWRQTRPCFDLDYTRDHQHVLHGNISVSRIGLVLQCVHVFLVHNIVKVPDSSRLAALCARYIWSRKIVTNSYRFIQVFFMQNRVSIHLITTFNVISYPNKNISHLPN